MNEHTRVAGVAFSMLATGVVSALLAAAPAMAFSDDCATATPVGNGEFVYDTTSATDDGPSPCAAVGSKDVWFLYTAPASANITVSTCGSNFGPSDGQSVVAVYTGSCASPTNIACSFSGCGIGATATFAASAGAAYLIQIGGGCEDCRSVGIVSIVSDASPPGNDACAAPTVISDGVHSFTTIGATTDGAASCADSIADVWFLYTPTSSGMAEIKTCGSDFNTVLTVYDGSTCAAPEIACSDDDCRTQSLLLASLVGGQPYLIRVGGAPPPARGPAQGVGKLAVRLLHPPANDGCANATPIGEGAFAFTNVDATTDGQEDCDDLAKDVWFRYTPTATGLATARAAGFDTTMSVYEGGCDGTQLGCIQDTASVEAQLSFGVDAGNEYTIRIGGAGEQEGSGVLLVHVDGAPANDTCASATEVGLGSTPFSTRGATTDPVFLSCALSLDHIASDVWFAHTVTGAGDLTISTCGSAFDTLMALYAACPIGDGEELACDDNSCGDGGPSLITLHNVSAGQRVYIRVGSADGIVGDGVLNVSLAQGGCAVGPEASSIVEPEPCGTSSNGGCADGNDLFTDLGCAPEQTVYGTAFSGDGLRDTDWYRVTLANEGVITWGGRAEFPAIFTIRSGVCQGDELARAVVRTPCDAESLASIRVNAGTYYLVVVPSDFFSGASCANASHYLARLRVNCDPIGACCQGGSCSLQTSAACAAGNGNYLGDRSACDTIAYTPQDVAGSFESIATTGQRGPECDGCEMSVPIGFPFGFYGRTYSSVWVNANGFLSFGPVGFSDFPHPIPRNWSPNNVIAPYWTDLWSTYDGGVTYQTLGTAPNRRFIAQWTGMPRFFDTIPSTFQVVLFEGSGAMEFRYQTVAPTLFEDQTAIGVEDADGLRATSLDPFVDRSNTAVRLTSAGSGNCSACRADTNMSGSLTVQDIFDFLATWFAGGPGADFNQTGGINVQDIFDFLAAWFAGC